MYESGELSCRLHPGHLQPCLFLTQQGFWFLITYGRHHISSYPSGYASYSASLKAVFKNTLHHIRATNVNHYTQHVWYRKVDSINEADGERVNASSNNLKCCCQCSFLYIDEKGSWTRTDQQVSHCSHQILRRPPFHWRLAKI